MKKREFVLGDVHGGFRAMKQVFERSGFDYKKDKLIFLGDVADGWTETYECIEEFMKIKNLVFVRGNHDVWLEDWLREGKRPIIWTSQGGENTLKSYLKETPEDWKRHLDFLKKTNFYYVDEKMRCFVHGGISRRGIPIEECDKDFLSWDRDLWDYRHSEIDISPYTEVFVGHTSIWRLSHLPLTYNKVTFMDTGGGWEGRLSMMNINTREVFQSDEVKELYPGVRHR